MITPGRPEEAKTKTLAFWESEVKRLRKERLARNPGAQRGLEIKNVSKAAEALFMSAQGTTQDEICERLGISRCDFWRLNRQFYPLLRKRPPVGRKMKRLLVIRPKSPCESTKGLDLRIKQLGALIPHTKRGTYENERPEIILDAARRLGRRLIYHFQ